MSLSTLDDTMVLLTYSPREGIEATEYEDWLCRVDNPFFNSVPGVLRYTNWKVAAGMNGLPFSHFDFLELESPEAFDAVWANPDLTDFRRQWRELWGRKPDQDSPDNSHAYLCRREAGRPQAMVPIVMLTPVSAGNGEGESWTVLRSLKGGTQRFERFSLRFLGAETADEPLRAGAIRGDLIAQPPAE